jgi:GT2 family glycosyltransferase
VQLSVIIISYQVRFFLEQCLHALQRAIEDIDAEIIVIDNASTDQTVAILTPLFPQVQFISNTVNIGFGAANNQGFGIAKGEYILLLNPDTLVPETAITEALHQLSSRPNVAAAGFRMVDGRGRFLPESKRSFPAPWIAFTKLTGLSALFPRSRWFNRYALGYLPEKEVHEVDILAGAAMLIRSTALQQTGGFDESFFLYGEDIDLCYRFRKAGYTNLYLGQISIIHFKGESSAGDWLRRTKYFYEAMRVFVRKHYPGSSRKLFSVALQIAILLRGLLSTAAFILRPVAGLAAEMLVVWICLQTFRQYWIIQVIEGLDFGVAFVPYALVLFAFLLTAGARFFSAGKKNNYLMGWLLVAAVYALLPEQVRFSRAVILGGSFVGAFVLYTIQTALRKRRLQKNPGPDAALLAWASERDYTSLSALLEQSQAGDQLIQRIPLTDNQIGSSIRQSVNAPIKKSLPHALVCCIGDLSLQTVIDHFPFLKKHPCLFFYTGSNSIVGSHTLAPGGTIVSPQLPYRLATTAILEWKRRLDSFVAFFLLISFPLHFICCKNAGQLWKNAAAVLAGKYTWVGYISTASGLPALPPAIIPHSDAADNALQADRSYARHYRIRTDLQRLLKAYRQLGNTPLHSDI